MFLSKLANLLSADFLMCKMNKNTCFIRLLGGLRRRVVVLIGRSGEGSDEDKEKVMVSNKLFSLVASLPFLIIKCNKEVLIKWILHPPPLRLIR